MLNKILAPFTKWTNALLGRPVASGAVPKPEPEKAKTAKEPQSYEPEGREISEQEMKDVKGEGDLLSKAQPLIAKGGEISGKTISSAGGIVKKLPLKGLLIAVGVLIVVSLALSQSSRLIELIKNRGREQAQPSVEPTPTPAGYQVYKPSVYAGDPDILKLEEEVNIYDREVSSTVLKETTLNPPNLDFNINFKK